MAMTVNFHGIALYGERKDETAFIALKPIVEAMGLAWQGQLERVKRDPVLREGISVMLMPSRRGQQETVSLRIDLLHGWLFTISALRIKSAEVRERVILFQRECYAVLAGHFLNQKPTVMQSASYERRSIERKSMLTRFDRECGAWECCGFVHIADLKTCPICRRSKETEMTTSVKVHVNGQYRATVKQDGGAPVTVEGNEVRDGRARPDGRARLARIGEDVAIERVPAHATSRARRGGVVVIRNDKPVPEHLRHRIEFASPLWQLVTHWGYILTQAPTRDEVREYYARHCCA